MKKTLSILLTLILLLNLAGCGSSASDKTITVAASPTPHAEILKVAAEVLAKDGWTLEIKEYTDYVQPNNVVEDGEIDANYFQHVPYLDTFNADNGTHLVSVAMIHCHNISKAFPRTGNLRDHTVCRCIYRFSCRGNDIQTVVHYRHLIERIYLASN